jgi:hypothetical protein
MKAITCMVLDPFGSGVMLPSVRMVTSNGVTSFGPCRPATMEDGKRINSGGTGRTLAVRDGAAGFAIGASGNDFIRRADPQIAALMPDFG